MKRFPLLPTLLLSVLCACGGGQPQPGAGGTDPPPGEGAPITAIIGPAGGQLRLPDGSVRIDIPAGALSREQTVGLQEIERTTPLQTGRAYRLTPEGVTFARPVRLTFRYTDEDVVGTAPEVLTLGFRDDQGVWQMYKRPTRDLASKTVAVETNHFSEWSMLKGMQLLPLETEVMTGQAVNFQVADCFDRNELEADPDDLWVPSPPPYECRPAVTGFTAREWAVNGTAGGNATVGTVGKSSGAGGTGTYTAPARKPAASPVMVSVRVSDLTFGDFLLVARVTVKEGAAWQGTVTYTETGARPWVMRDGFEGSGLEKATQTHTFKVVGARKVDDSTTVLLLEQDALAAYEDKGHMEKKIYEICQAFGPVILRHHFIYDRNFYMGGSLRTTIEARLNVVDGRYSLAISPKDVELTGQDAVTDISKDGCAGTTNDRSRTQPKKTLAAPENLRVEGKVDPAHPETLTGGYEGKGEIFVQPTTYTVSWNLTRAP